MDAKHPRLRQAFREQLADSLRKPLPGLTRRHVFGAVRFPGKATAVVGMRRAGKTTFLHQLRQERIEQGFPRSGCRTSRPPIRQPAWRCRAPASGCCRARTASPRGSGKYRDKRTQVAGATAIRSGRWRGTTYFVYDRK